MSNSEVDLSIVVPVYNDPAGLQTTIDSLLDQTATGYEIIIADNGSTDATRTVAREFAEDDRVTLVVEDEIQGSYAARNLGIEAATGDILCFVDADMWVESDWVTSVRARMDEGVEYLCCNVIVRTSTDSLAARYNERTGFPVESYIREKHFAPTCCLAVTREVIETVGPFDPRLISGGDVEFGRRVHRAGFRQEFAESIRMSHPARTTVTALARKHYRMGRGRSQLARYHPDIESRHPLHPFKFLPVRPSTVSEPFDSEPLPRQAAYFLLATVLKWSATAGRIREWLRPTRQDVEWNGETTAAHSTRNPT